MTTKKPDARGFTDLELAELQNALFHDLSPDADMTLRLLARLRAAEAVASTMEETARYSECAVCFSTESDDGEVHFNHEENCELMAEINAWKRSKGEGERNG